MTDWQAFYDIQSDQADLHPRLDDVVSTHVNTPFLKPISPLQRHLFDHVMSQVDGPLVLDCGCGTGMSTQILAKRFPSATVVGLDQSLHRLERHPLFRSAAALPMAQEGNLILVQADVVAWWQLIAEHAVRVHQACFYYPNPWPKAKHLQRRWHGHAIWPLVCGGAEHVVMRTNWWLYAKEWQRALSCCQRQAELRTVAVTTMGAISLFERKYAQAHVSCYEVESVATMAETV